MKPARILLLALCLAAGFALAADGLHGAARSYKFREDWADGIPKAWGRLIHASSFSDGSTAMFFEASDGTIRRVGAKFVSTDVQYSPRVTVIPRP